MMSLVLTCCLNRPQVLKGLQVREIYMRSKLADLRCEVGSFVIIISWFAKNRFLTNFLCGGKGSVVVLEFRMKWKGRD